MPSFGLNRERDQQALKGAHNEIGTHEYSIELGEDECTLFVAEVC